MQIDLSTMLGGISLSSGAMNAAGAGSSTAQEMRGLATSDAGAVVMKSTTVAPVPDGEPRLAGLVNPGYRDFLSLVGELRALGNGKPVIASLAGFSVEDYAIMTTAYAEAGADIIELNLADPNVVCNVRGHCDVGVVQAILAQVRNTQVSAPIAVKLPGFQERVHLAEVLDLLRQATIPIVICLNAPVGDTASSTPLTHVQVAAGAGAFDVIAVGGVKDGNDMYQAVAQGAAGVQIGSAIQQEGPALFTRLHGELAELLQQAGYQSLSDLRRASQA